MTLIKKITTLPVYYDCEQNSTRPDYIRFGDLCLKHLDIQCQTGYYLLEGLAGHPELKEGLRLIDGVSYHSIWIHREDAKVFADRVYEWRHKYD